MLGDQAIRLAAEDVVSLGTTSMTSMAESCKLKHFFDASSTK